MGKQTAGSGINPYIHHFDVRIFHGLGEEITHGSLELDAFQPRREGFVVGEPQSQGFSSNSVFDY
jgi:hypothetical protein